MIRKYWPYLLIIISLIFFISTWSIAKDRSIVLPTKVKQNISLPTPTISNSKND